MWKIHYLKKVLDVDIPNIDRTDLERINKSIENKLAWHPENYGKALAGIFKGLYKFRIGHYRVIYKIENGKILIVIIISHRKDVYAKLEKRI